MTDEYKDEIRDRAGIDALDLYRVGVPSIGETYGRRWNANRNTGGLGTGIYAFTTREAAEDNADADQEVFVLENALSNPIKPADWSTTTALNDASREAARLIVAVSNGETTFEEARMDPPRRLSRKAREVLFDTPQLRDQYGLDSDEFTRAWVDAAKTAKSAREQMERGTAVQPVNLLLYPAFGGVYPKGEAGESGTYGAVIFKEKVDDCVGHRTERSEEVAADVLNDCFRRNV